MGALYTNKSLKAEITIGGGTNDGYFNLTDLTILSDGSVKDFGGKMHYFYNVTHKHEKTDIHFYRCNVQNEEGCLTELKEPVNQSV